jgi:hypothetical protein
MNPKAVTPAPFAEPISNSSTGWVSFFNGLLKGFQPQGGTTAQRPTAPALWQDYFDTTLGYKITCKQITPSVVWVNGAGTTV